jgi:hypothetical protein
MTNGTYGAELTMGTTLVNRCSGAGVIEQESMIRPSTSPSEPLVSILFAFALHLTSISRRT